MDTTDSIKKAKIAIEKAARHAPLTHALFALPLLSFLPHHSAEGARGPDKRERRTSETRRTSESAKQAEAQDNREHRTSKSAGRARVRVGQTMVRTSHVMQVCVMRNVNCFVTVTCMLSEERETGTGMVSDPLNNVTWAEGRKGP